MSARDELLALDAPGQGARGVARARRRGRRARATAAAQRSRDRRKRSRPRVGRTGSAHAATWARAALQLDSRRARRLHALQAAPTSARTSSSASAIPTRRWCSSARRRAPKRTSTGEPFVGAAGQLLTKMIEAMGLGARATSTSATSSSAARRAIATPSPTRSPQCEPFLKRQLAAHPPAHDRLRSASSRRSACCARTRRSRGCAATWKSTRASRSCRRSIRRICCATRLEARGVDRSQAGDGAARPARHPAPPGALNPIQRGASSSRPSCSKSCSTALSSASPIPSTFPAGRGPTAVPLVRRNSRRGAIDEPRLITHLRGHRGDAEHRGHLRGDKLGRRLADLQHPVGRLAGGRAKQRLKPAKTGPQGGAKLVHLDRAQLVLSPRAVDLVLQHSARARARGWRSSARARGAEWACPLRGGSVRSRRQEGRERRGRRARADFTRA